MSNSLDPDQSRYFVKPGLVPNCLHRLSADDTSRQSKCTGLYPNILGKGFCVKLGKTILEEVKYMKRPVLEYFIHKKICCGYSFGDFFNEHHIK